MFLAKHTVRFTVGNPQKRQIVDPSVTEPDFDELAKKIPESFLKNARKVCQDTISGSTACAGTTNTTVIVEGCYRDAILTNSLEFTSDHLHNFNQICLAATKSLEAIGSDDATFEGMLIQQQAGLGEFPCPQNCNSRGQCLEFGCDCKAGFTGAACEIKL
jgi:hypothetical protein